MNEEEKENYFNDGIISYFRSSEKERENILLNNNFERKSINSLNINLKDINDDKSNNCIYNNSLPILFNDFNNSNRQIPLKVY